MKNFYQNPFALLGANPRDNRQRIIELAEEMSLKPDLDSESCTKARSDLINLRSRISAEIAWLPGLSPRRATDLVKLLKQNPNSIRQQDLPALAKANLLAAVFEYLDPKIDTDHLVQWILDLAYTVDEIDLEKVLREINEDRSVSGFREIQNLDILEAEFKEYRRHYQEVISASLNRLPTLKLINVITAAVETAK